MKYTLLQWLSWVVIWAGTSMIDAAKNWTWLDVGGMIVLVVGVLMFGTFVKAETDETRAP